VGDISEKAAPKDYVLWLDKCGYIISEAWRRAVGLERTVFGGMEKDQLSSLQEDNAQLRRELESLLAKTGAQDDLEKQVVALDEENENLLRQLKQQDPSVNGRTEKAQPPSCEKEAAEEIKILRKQIRLLRGEPANHNEVGALTRKAEFLQILLLATAVDGHAFDPRSSKSNVPKEIADKSAQLGHAISASTVRKYLLESSSMYVDPDVWCAIFP